MQALRNLTWWLTGLATLLVFVLVTWLSTLLNGQFWEIPKVAILCVYVGLCAGFLNPVKLFKLGETLTHEIGHAQMAALTFGKVSFIRVERDTSGVTYHRPSFLLRRLTTALVSLFGPISSAVVFLVTSRFVASELTAYWALGLGIFISLILITTVRNFWGWITGLFLLGVLYLVLEATGFLTPQLLSSQSLITTNNILVEVILWAVAFNLGSALRYSWQCRKAQNPGSDEFKFSQALFLPRFIGGHLIFLIQLALLWVGLSYLLGWSSPLVIGRWI
jgi:hypothetical protein